MRRELADSRVEYERQLLVIRGQLTRMNKNIIRFINRPAHPLHHQPNNSEPNQQHNNFEVPALLVTENVEMEEPVEPRLVAKLSSCPKSLHDLWREYTFGSPGVKAAKDFTEKERGSDKSKYYRRNIVWRKVSELILAGYSADEACDLIYRCYGRGSSVTRLINFMIRDKKTGGHPMLAIRQR